MNKLIVHLEFNTEDRLKLKHVLDVYLLSLGIEVEGLDLDWRFFDSIEEATAWEESRK